MTAPASYVVPTTDWLNYGNRPGDGPLRVGGQAPPSQMVKSDGDLPSTDSPQVAKQRAVLEMVRDVQGGTAQLRIKGPKYLPQSPGERAADYNIRLNRSVFFNVFNHTVDALAGFVFRKDPVLGDDVPPAIVEHAENIDLTGTHLDVFARDLLADALAVGHCGILVDYPKTDGSQTAADEGPDKIRPYWVPIKKDNIISWRTMVENGHLYLAQIVLREATYAPAGTFGEATQVRYRVLYRVPGAPPVVGFKLLQIAEDKKSVMVVDQGLYGNQDEIPFAEIGSSGRLGLLESNPPLADLAYLNVAHYQQWSDYAMAIHMTNVPLLTIAGLEAPSVNSDGQMPEIVVGPNALLTSTNPAFKAAYISHNGQALHASKESLDDLIQNMAVLGVAMLVTTTRQAQTAEAKRIDKGSFDSQLAVTARGLQDGIERALGFHAKYLKLATGGSIVINRDFENMTMDAQMLTAYASAVSNAGLPIRMLLEAMQEGGLISADLDIDDLEMQTMANAAAQQAQKDAENALKMKQIDAAGGGAGAQPGGIPDGPSRVDSGEGEGVGTGTQRMAA